MSKIRQFLKSIDWTITSGIFGVPLILVAIILLAKYIFIDLGLMMVNITILIIYLLGMLCIKFTHPKESWRSVLFKEEQK